MLPRVKKYPLLLPLSFLYGLGVRLRNWLFDKGFLRSKSFPLPVIGIGNITVGGTGKTPHTEYLVRLLSEHRKVAVLSRGYKRKSKGFLLYKEGIGADEIGDEPCQMARKFPQIHIAVDADRVHGVETLLRNAVTHDTEVVLLDDAYQHRYIKPGLQILLIDHERPITNDWLLPAGRLREPVKGKERADIIIVSKCPPDVNTLAWHKHLAPTARQQLFFTELVYGDLYEPFTQTVQPMPDDQTHVLLLSGIASPARMETYLRKHTSHIRTCTFADHHNFTETELSDICAAFERLPSPRMLITTEKDAARLLTHPHLPTCLRDNMKVLPITAGFMHDTENMFNKIITDYVTENTRNCGVSAQ